MTGPDVIARAEAWIAEHDECGPGGCAFEDHVERLRGVLAETERLRAELTNTATALAVANHALGLAAPKLREVTAQAERLRAELAGASENMVSVLRERDGLRALLSEVLEQLDSEESSAVTGDIPASRIERIAERIRSALGGA